MAFNSAKSVFKRAAVATVSLAALSGMAHAQQAVKPYYGNIRPFYGNIRAFYGNIRPFYGNLRPFYGNIRPFYGNIRPFWGDANPFVASADSATNAFFSPTNSNAFWGTGSSNPFFKNPSPYVNYSQISGFWSTEAANWDQVEPLWASAQTDAGIVGVAQKLQSLILAPAASFWGRALLQGTHTTSFAAGARISDCSFCATPA